MGVDGARFCLRTEAMESGWNFVLLPTPPSSSSKVVEEGTSWGRLRCTKLPEKHRFLIKGQWMRCRDSRTPKIYTGLCGFSAFGLGLGGDGGMRIRKQSFHLTLR